MKNKVFLVILEDKNSGISLSQKNAVRWWMTGRLVLAQFQPDFFFVLTASISPSRTKYLYFTWTLLHQYIFVQTIINFVISFFYVFLWEPCKTIYTLSVPTKTYFGAGSQFTLKHVAKTQDTAEKYELRSSVKYISYMFFKIKAFYFCYLQKASNQIVCYSHNFSLKIKVTVGGRVWKSQVVWGIGSKTSLKIRG